MNDDYYSIGFNLHILIDLRRTSCRFICELLY